MGVRPFFARTHAAHTVHARTVARRTHTAQRVYMWRATQDSWLPQTTQLVWC